MRYVSVDEDTTQKEEMEEGAKTLIRFARCNDTRGMRSGGAARVREQLRDMRGPARADVARNPD